MLNVSTNWACSARACDSAAANSGNVIRDLSAGDLSTRGKAACTWDVFMPCLYKSLMRLNVAISSTAYRRLTPFLGLKNASKSLDHRRRVLVDTFRVAAAWFGVIMDLSFRNHSLRRNCRPIRVWQAFLRPRSPKVILLQSQPKYQLENDRRLGLTMWHK